jgi:hypothetical protein
MLLTFVLQNTDPRVSVSSEIRRQCEGVISRACCLAREFDTLPVEALSAKWAAPQAQGEVGAVMAQLSGTSSAEAFISMFLSICRVADSLLKHDNIVVDIRPPVKIFGDIHGQLQDLLRLFSSHGFPIVGCGGDIDVVTYVFNGDFVDRGPHQLEVQRRLYLPRHAVCWVIPSSGASAVVFSENCESVARHSFARESRNYGHQFRLWLQQRMPPYILLFWKISPYLSSIA